MENKITSIIEYMAKSHLEMASILEAKRYITVHMANMIDQIPDINPTFGEIEDLIVNSLEVTKGVTNYLNSLATLEEAIADNLALIMKELKEQPSEE